MYSQQNIRFARLSRPSGRSTGLLGKVVATVAALGLLALSLMFSVVVLAVGVVGGAIAWAYLWWKTRTLRRQMREQAGMAEAVFRQRASSDAKPEARDDGIVLEGEVIREVPEEETRR
ncbi:MAG: hypothetical protein CGU28_03550 [Candidatus Dactylopiibacterium carminicum]|uniref:Uncharacterized protein n=1 Tax=Candidatus Dactylopiibacterium carminicum TaxID=857335 RepID=A0A272EY59_9RHOO|nr:hypothetical protein [Candidatus Dactylopiibacterium carminicum]KAF7600443.1 hypothetical protein BGI27_02555 [Candidatus Dactylopiibacterium carminicum]PAS95064.1 MAG: hypothetical protein CGU29_01035 [Candidatus Dactylopiibacterium carminicum]PAS97829.1 MAG: hypothetical protein CGU28_03550 [Candidatus Dactylopiibacterium carminicum]PAT00442.1 MAG: hypothetical protein BSR46_02565 [Candidatus Dactylopiibacterium carminicum]